MERQELFGRLERAGCHPQQALERFMNNEDLFLSFLKQLPERMNLTPLFQGLEREDEEQFYRYIHDLKGMTGNLGLTPVYDCAQAMLVEFRTSKFKHKNKLTALTLEVQTECRALTKLVQQYEMEEER